jgi:hypothetical protein
MERQRQAAYGFRQFAVVAAKADSQVVDFTQGLGHIG